MMDDNSTDVSTGDNNSIGLTIGALNASKKPQPIWMYTLPFQVPIIFLAVFGNSMVCLAVYRRYKARKLSGKTGRGLGARNSVNNNMFALIFNMACADLGVGIFTMPVSVLLCIHPDYDLGIVACMMQIVSYRGFLCVSILTMLCLSVDRYFVICTSSKKRIHLKLAIALTWGLSVLGFFINLFRTHDYRISAGMRMCIIYFKNEDLILQTADVSLIGALVVYGIVSLTFFYTKMFLVTHNQIKFSVAHGLRSRQRGLVLQRKLAVMLLSSVLLFYLSWLPMMIYLCVVMKQGVLISDLPPWLGVFVTWMTYLQSALNPIIYSVGSSKMRAEFIAILKCRQIVSEAQWSSTNTANGRGSVQSISSIFNRGIENQPSFKV